ncbi:MAG: fluoride efflux transporter CrcB [Anaerovorax sp.]
MGNFMIVGLGGFIGAFSRYGVSQLLLRFWPALAVGSFPIGTFFVNGVGSFIIGVAAAVFTKTGAMGSPMQIFIMIGILGGFTTFSSFSLESVNLILQSKMGLASAYILGSVLVCLLGVYLGKVVGGLLA